MEGTEIAQQIYAHYVLTAGWAQPLLNAISAKPAFREKYSQWARSSLSDLAFSIETRLGALPEIVRLIDENLDQLLQELRRASRT